MAHEADDDEVVVRPAIRPTELVEDDELIVPGRRRRTPPGLIVASVGVLAGAVVGVAITNHAGHKATLPPPAASATVTATQPSSPADRTALHPAGTGGGSCPR
jgi:hypothetical protein